MSDRCRLCGSALPEAGRLRLDPAPAAAWAFVSAADAPPVDRSTLEIASCARCGLTQRVGAPVPTYRQVRSAALLSPSMRAHRATQAEAFIAHFGLAGKRVVEIGTGRGDLLPLLTAAGVVAEGVEAGGAPSDVVPGVTVQDGYPLDGALQGAPWDAAWCLNFLEHAPDPVGFLRGVADALVPGAPLLLEVPDHAQQRRLSRAFDYVADHLSYFEAESLTTALALGGFTVVMSGTVRDGENLEVWAVRRAVRTHAAEAASVAAARAAVRAFLAPAPERGGRAAVWGASHQALLLLADLGADAVSCVIDSSPSKQGHFTPVSRIPIVAPEQALAAGVDRVLIVAAGYEREIAQRLRALGFAGHVGRLEGEQVLDVG